MSCKKCVPSFWERQVEGSIKAAIGNWFTVGVVLAVIRSYEQFNSPFWAMLHGAAGWIYVFWPSVFPAP